MWFRSRELQVVLGCSPGHATFLRRAGLIRMRRRNHKEWECEDTELARYIAARAADLTTRAEMAKARAMYTLTKLRGKEKT